MFHGARDTIRRNMPVVAYESNEAAMADALSKDMTLSEEVRIQRSAVRYSASSVRHSTASHCDDAALSMHA